ncbi:MAG: hypothetical protein JXB47_06410 [Anaerolineae bacterium]|nr:hypothetical protein [Anaerolineae bacterium]
MITINVKVVLPSEETLDMELPLNTDIDQVYARLVTWGALPTITGRGEPIAYGFYHRRSESYLPAHVSLIDAGVRNGDLIDVTPWPTVEPPVRVQQLKTGRRKSPPRWRRAWLIYALLGVAVIVITAFGWSQISDRLNGPTATPKITQTFTGAQTVTFMTATTEPLETRTTPSQTQTSSNSPGPQDTLITDTYTPTTLPARTAQPTEQP